MRKRPQKRSFSHGRFFVSANYANPLHKNLRRQLIEKLHTVYQYLCVEDEFPRADVNVVNYNNMHVLTSGLQV